MDRLTGRSGNKAYLNLAHEYMSDEGAYKRVIDNAIYRLSAYEDTGLSPDDIARLTAENKQTTTPNPIRYYKDGKPYLQIADAELINHPAVDKLAEFDRVEKYVMPHMQAEIASLTAELEQYREAEAEGLLVRLPCKVGDTVYWISLFGTGINQGDVVAIKISAFGYYLEISRSQCDHSTIKRGFEKVFLTREEAEAALKEQEAPHARP